MIFTLEEAADLADIKVPQLRLWIHTGKFKVERCVRPVVPQLEGPTYFFGEDDIPRLVAFAATQSKRKPTKSRSPMDDSTPENFTVAQLARKWNLSEDVIRREFENEEGVLKLARARKGKRPYKTLRIPAAVAERVKRRLSS
jgi:hypothetical protein